MLGIMHMGYLLLLVFSLESRPVEKGYLVLSVADASGRLRNDIGVTCKEGCSTGRSDSRGIARLKLPPQMEPGHEVTLVVVNLADSPYQVLLSPWNNIVSVPPFEDESKNRVSIVVSRKGDRDILSSGIAIESIIARALKAERPKVRQEISAEERKRALQQQANEVGLTLNEITEAIREWGSKAKDPYQQGLAALIKDDFARATPLLEESERLAEGQGVLTAKVRDFGSEICVAKINDDNDRVNMIENRQCLESAPKRMAQNRWPKPRRFQRSIQPK